MIKGKTIPPPPEKPDPFECCGSGCVPCIFDYYEQKLMAWEETFGISVEDYRAGLTLEEKGTT